MASRHHSRMLVVFWVLMSCLTPAWAQSPTPLQVTASGAQTQTQEFSLAELDAMEQVEFTTTTIWTDGAVTFSGVPLKVLLTAITAKGASVEMVALNDYKVVMPFTEMDDAAPIVATRMNGETMSVRDKGPYWVVFPYDADPKYQTETIYSYSIWQLNRLKVVD